MTRALLCRSRSSRGNARARSMRGLSSKAWRLLCNMATVSNSLQQGHHQQLANHQQQQLGRLHWRGCSWRGCSCHVCDIAPAGSKPVGELFSKPRLRPNGRACCRIAHQSSCSYAVAAAEQRQVAAPRWCGVMVAVAWALSPVVDAWDMQ